MAKIEVRKQSLRAAALDGLHEWTSSIFELPVVFTGTMKRANQFCKDLGLVFVSDNQNLFGGYWYDENKGDTYWLT